MKSRVIRRLVHWPGERLILSVVLMVAAGIASPGIAPAAVQRGLPQDSMPQGRNLQLEGPGVASRVTTPKMPDLVVLGPAVSEMPSGASSSGNVVWHPKRHEWTVRNVGAGQSSSTDLKLDCDDHHPPEEAYCAGGSHNWNFVVPIPPLASGQAHKVDSQTFMKSKCPGCSGAVIMIPETKSTDPGAPGTIAPYAIRFTAVVDPTNKIPEQNEANNQLKYDDAHKKSFGQKILVAPPKPKLTPEGPGAKVALVPGGPQILPQLSLSTEKPWSPGATTWLLAKNIGGFDAPPSQVKGACVNLTNIELNKEREEKLKELNEQISQWEEKPASLMKSMTLENLYKLKSKYSFPFSTHCDFNIPASVPVPALKHGESHGILYFMTQHVDYKYRITFQPPKGSPLVLAN